MIHDSHNSKIAIVHDWITDLGGAERVLKVLHEMFPQSPVYTLFHNPIFSRTFLPQADIRPSFLQKAYIFLGKKPKWLWPFLPVAVESLDLAGYDLVISSSIAFSKGLILKPKTKHLCYCYSPTRFLWDWHQEYHGGKKNPFLFLAQHFLRIWDRQAAGRVDQFVAISQNVRQRIKKYYRQDAVVIYPPLVSLIDTPLKAQTLSYRPELKNYFLIVSRLFPHKNIHLAIEAFEKLSWPLVIVGDGPERRKLEKLIERKDLIRMVGRRTDEETAVYYAHAKAFIMPQEEDFGLTPLEAMSFGKPVLALRRGGALEYIEEGVNGEFFDDPHPAVLADGARRLSENYGKYNPALIKKTAGRFSRQRFEKEIKELITSI